MKLLTENSLDYRRLKEKYPYSSEFYSVYYSGSYYDRAWTKYYDQNKNYLEIEMHSWYG